MFAPRTERIKEIAESNPEVVSQLESIFEKSTRVYIDYANVRPWSNKLRWHIDLKRLKQFFDSFDTIEAINFYGGYLEGDEQSEKEIKEVENQKYVVRTKPVKIMRLPIDASSIPSDSTALLNQFIRRALLRKSELNELREVGLRIFDIYDIKDFICWKKEIGQRVK